MPPLRTITKLIFFVLVVCCHCSIAQDEGSIWFLGSGQGLDFSQSPPSATPVGGVSTTASSGEGFASCIQNGKVIFYSSGRSVGYPNGLAVENGYYLYGTSERQVIIQKPGSTSQYYLFYVAMLSWNRRDVMYAVIEVQPSGTVIVLEKNKLLYAGIHGYFTISAGCAGDSYWLVGEADRNATEGTDKMVSFKIDSQGISDMVVSTPLQMTESGAYRFSPDGTKLFFHFSGSGSEGTALADFDRFTGIVSNVKVIGPCCGFGEFSSNGRLLYTNYSTTDKVSLVQYDLSQSTITSTTVATVPFHGTRLQIAKDEKIYIVLMTKDTTSFLGVITSPNQVGVNCNFEMLKPFPWIHDTYNNVLVLPEFSTNAFYKSPYSSADAGKDIAVCMGDTISIGGITNSSNQRYQWSPNVYLENPQAAQTDFVFNEVIVTSDTLQFILKGFGDECVEADTMTVVVHPRPMPLISGSPSVCPGVSSVLYSTGYNPSYRYDWSIEGGTITSDQDKDSIRVDWGDANPEARIHLSVNNEFDCISALQTFPVRINVKLETQTPIGPLQVCDNLVANNSYQITNTNGSIYTWEIMGGVIRQGQGSNKLRVDWLPSGPHQLWVLEKSTTKDTVCFGSSDTLRVKVYRDSLQLLVNQVSINSKDDSKAIVWGELKHAPSNFSAPIVLSRKDHHETNWTTIKEHVVPENLHLLADDHNLKTDEVVYDYQFSTINGCQVETFSDVHHTIRTEATAVEEDGKIVLQWNPYDGWQDGILRYEIWRKIDSDTAFAFVKSIDAHALDLMDADKGFRHAIKIKAVSLNDTLYSWSNQIEVAFEHALFIPNIFTPTGDNKNETFTFNHIELYPDNELVIYNRYSTEVYRQRNYTGTWNGEDLSSGIYYYYLQIFSPEKKQSYKGWIQILR